MKVNQIPQINTNPNNQTYNKQNTPSFGGFWSGAFNAVSQGLRFLDTNQAWGANAVDLCFMVTPRTAIDFTRKDSDGKSTAGWETLRRESMGTINHSSIGLYGTLAGLAVATALNGAYGFNSKKDIMPAKIFADANTIDLHSKIFGEKILSDSEKPIREYVKEVLRSYETLSPTENGKWVPLGEEQINQAAKILEDEILATGKEIHKDSTNMIRSLLISSQGTENNFRIRSDAGIATSGSKYSIDNIIENIYKLGKTFNKESVKQTFIEAGAKAENTFVKGLKAMNFKRSLAGIAIASAVGICAQPFNMYLTKKKTGQEGFVGGGEKDNSIGFKIRKGIVAALFLTGALATIGNPKNLLHNLQFQGFTPTMSQFKFVYGITITSRLLSARNDNELKEATIKDTLGFANWLILGNFVQKLVASKMDPSLIKHDGKGLKAWIGKSALKTRDEILHTTLGDKVFKDGKALNYKQMMELIPKGSSARKQLHILNIAQCIGYLYSAAVLGVGIPALNKYLTNRREAKKAQMNAANPIDNMLSQNNIAFLSSKLRENNIL